MQGFLLIALIKWLNFDYSVSFFGIKSLATVLGKFMTWLTISSKFFSPQPFSAEIITVFSCFLFSWFSKNSRASSSVHFLFSSSKRSILFSTVTTGLSEISRSFKTCSTTSHCSAALPDENPPHAAVRLPPSILQALHEKPILMSGSF